MGRIVITANTSLDGYIQDPDGQEGFPRGGWFNEHGGEDLAEWVRVETEEALRADALLLGRRSDEWFASRWQSREGPWADRLNHLPKYVVSSTLTEPRWSNAKVVSGELVSRVAELKQQHTGEILIYASYQLAHALVEHDLVDELRLVIFPVLLGAGESLFGPTGEKKPLRLVSQRTVGGGLALVTYEIPRTT